MSFLPQTSRFRAGARRPAVIAAAFIWILAVLLLPGCNQEVVDETAFRKSVTGSWVQSDKVSASPYWEFTEDGKVRDVLGREIGEYKSAGSYQRIQVKVPPVADFTSSFIVAKRRNSISFTDTRFGPFQKATKALRERALYEIHQPLIIQNLDALVAAARDVRRDTGKQVLRYEDLTGPDKPIKELAPVAGEDYSMLEFKGDTLLRVKTEYGMEVLAQE